MYTHFNYSILEGNNFKLVKNIYFTQENVIYQRDGEEIVEPVIDYFYRVVSNLAWNYSANIENNGTHITMTFSFTNSDASNNLDGIKTKLCK